jgi:hypothetical protein
VRSTRLNRWFKEADTAAFSGTMPVEKICRDPAQLLPVGDHSNGNTVPLASMVSLQTSSLEGSRVG